MCNGHAAAIANNNITRKEGRREWRVPGLEVMCDEVPESMYQSEVLVGGGGEDECAA